MDDVLVDDAPVRIEPAKSSYTIPDFRADDAAIKSLEVRIAHLISISIQAGLETARAAHTDRRKELVASAVFFQNLAKEAVAEIAVATDEFNASVNRNTTDRAEARAAPTLLFEDLLTLGRAGRKHGAMLRAESKSAKLNRRVRETQIAVEKHDALLAQLLLTREAEWRKHFESESGQAEIKRDSRISKLASQVDAIHAERKAFERRLKDGRVNVDELRAREMSREKLAFLCGKVDGLYFNGEVRYEDYHRYLSLARDRTGRDSALGLGRGAPRPRAIRIQHRTKGRWVVPRRARRLVRPARRRKPVARPEPPADGRCGPAAYRSSGEFTLDLEDPVA